MVDITGDGLPDQIVNGLVYFNLGDRFVRSNISSMDMHDLSLSSSFDWTAGFGASLGSGPPEEGSGSTGFSTSSNNGYSINQTLRTLIDINGSGRPDIVTLQAGYVTIRFNTGMAFTAARAFDKGSWATTIEEYPYEYREMISYLSSQFVLSVGSRASPSRAALNVVRGYLSIFDSNHSPSLSVRDSLRASGSLSIGHSFGLNMAIMLPVPPPVPVVRLGPIIGTNNSMGASVSFSSIDLRDITGNGLPDHVYVDMHGNMQVKVNQLARVGQLSEIRRSSGARTTINYSFMPPTQNRSSGQYLVSAITHHDGFGNDFTTRYGFYEPFQDRDRKSFLGFGRTTITNSDGLVSESINNHLVGLSEANSSREAIGAAYRARGLVTHQRSHLNGILIGESSYSHQLFMGQNGSYHWRLMQVESTSFDPNDAMVAAWHNAEAAGSSLARSALSRTTRHRFAYDSFGNVVRFYDDGVVVNGISQNGTISSEITYRNQASNSTSGPFLPSLPTRMVVRHNGVTLRERSAEYSPNGNLIALHVHNGGQRLTTSYTYDQFGNVTRVVDPTGYTVTITYDSVLNQFPIAVSDSFGLRSTTEFHFDHRIGQVHRATDPTGHSFTYKYDNFNRLISVSSNRVAGHLLEIEYSHNQFRFGNSGVGWRVSDNGQVITDNSVNNPLFVVAQTRVSQHNSQTITTITMVDGLNRALQSWVQAEIYEGNGRSVTGFTVSGAIRYDHAGRIIEQGQPVFRAGGPSFSYQAVPMINPTRFVFDSLGVPIKTILPDGSNQSGSYGLVMVDGEVLNRITLTDVMGRISSLYSDHRGLPIQSTITHNGQLLTMRNTYDILGQPLTNTDVDGNVTIRVEYDMLGRPVSYFNINSGLTTFEYDNAGRLVQRQTANLRERNAFIRYEYHYHRLMRIVNPFSNDVVYQYFGPNQGNNSGRISSIDNGTMRTEVEYGNFGEIIRRTQTVQRAIGNPYTVTFEYQIGLLGQMESILFPDGERVSYNYNSGMQVQSVVGDRFGMLTRYVDFIGYDHFGRRTFMRLGNGVETSYQYDDQRMWLEQLTTTNSQGETLQNLSYEFDRLGNIRSIQNNTTNRQIRQSFEYDDLNQLTHAEGSFRNTRFTQNNNLNHFTQVFSYDILGNMTSKVSTNVLANGSSPLALNYNYQFTFDTTNPYLLTSVGGRFLTHDLNGNVTSISTVPPSDEADWTSEIGNIGDGWGNEGAWAGNRTGESGSGSGPAATTTTYTWNENNQLI
jgi:YD repeat-containing protein